MGMQDRDETDMTPDDFLSAFEAGELATVDTPFTAGLPELTSATSTTTTHQVKVRLTQGFPPLAFSRPATVPSQAVTPA